MAEQTLGAIIRQRRQAMDMSQSALSGAMGGSPGPSFLTRIEQGSIEPTRSLALRLADALTLPRDVVLNAAGHATEDQSLNALERLQQLLGEKAPVMMTIQVWSADEPRATTGAVRQKLVRAKAPYRIVDLVGARNVPFEGEVLYDTSRRAADGNGVVAEVDGHLSAWTYRSTGRKVWIENGAGDRRGAGYTIHGVIVRVTTETELG